MDQPLQRLIDRLPIGIALLDVRGRIITSNSTFLAITGDCPANSRPSAIEKFLLSDTVQSQLVAVRETKAATNGGDSALPSEFEADIQLTRIVLAGDSTRFLELSARPFDACSHPEQGEAESALVVSAVDVTQRELNQRKLEEMNQMLIEADEEIDQFAYIIAHDLQEPIRKVSSFCTLIQEHLGAGLDETGDKYLGFAVDGSLRMKEMIEALLIYSRLRGNKEKIEKVSLQQCAEHAVAQLGSSIAHAKATIELGVLPDIEFDASRLTQLLFQLIDNAIKFRGEDAPIIRVSADRDETLHQWILEVADNGIGIEERVRDSVFEIFKMAHPRNAYPGTGIGLSLSKRIAEKRGGGIRIKNQATPGTIVVVTIPDLDRHDSP